MAGSVAPTVAAPTAPPLLLQPLRLRQVTLPARVAVAPMCQYSADRGFAQPWHAIHIGTFACGGFGLVTMEATAVRPEGRITPHCLGLWSDDHERALAAVLAQVRSVSDTPLGIQIAHAGRKAGTHRPFLGGPRGHVPLDQGGWEALGPSPSAFGSLPPPRELAIDELPSLAQAFAEAARRAMRLGFDYCEIHAAHGYLLSSFLSPLSNHRHDAYGGSLEGRMRFPLEVVEAVRAVWPHDRPLGVRFGGSDWADGGWSIDDAEVFAVELASRGVDVLSVSTGGNAPVAPAPSPGWLVPHARRIRDAVHRADPHTSAVIFAVGELDDPHRAERTLAERAADAILLGRGALRDPRFPWRAARVLGALPRCPPPYAWAVGV